MKPVCPRCQSSVVYVMTDSTNQQLIDELLSPAALIGLGVSLCKSFKLHPVIGVVAGTAIAPSSSLQSLIALYRCWSISSIAVMIASMSSQPLTNTLNSINYL